MRERYREKEKEGDRKREKCRDQERLASSIPNNISVPDSKPHETISTSCLCSLRHTTIFFQQFDLMKLASMDYYYQQPHILAKMHYEKYYYFISQIKELSLRESHCLQSMVGPGH